MSQPANNSDSDSVCAEVGVEKRRRRGRGSDSNRSGRFEVYSRVDVDDGWV